MEKPVEPSDTFYFSQVDVDTFRAGGELWGIDADGRRLRIRGYENKPKIRARLLKIIEDQVSADGWQDLSDYPI